MPNRITVVGLGLIGGSMGLRIRKLNLKNVEVVGHDRDPDAASKAKKIGAIDRIDWNLLNAVENASIVIIATPVLAVKTIMEQIAESLANGAIVIDTASTKARVVEWGDTLLPDYVHFIGTHPMAGKELPGIDAADATLFDDAVWCLCPSRRAEQSKVDVIVSLVENLGARPFFLDPKEHDGLVAGISHLPIVSSAALVAATVDEPSWREMRRLASTGYRDATRLASGDPTMNLDICLTNREHIVGWIDRYIDELKRYRQLIADGGEPLAKEFIRVQDERDRWFYNRKDDDGKEKIQAMSLQQFLLGDRLAKMADYLMQDPKKKKR